MGALLQGAGADLVPSDNSGLLSGLTAPAGGAAAAQQPSNGLLAALAARGGLRNDDGTVSPLNPVQQVGLQGLLGSLGPTRGGQAAAGGATGAPASAPVPQARPAAAGQRAPGTMTGAEMRQLAQQMNGAPSPQDDHIGAWRRNSDNEDHIRAWQNANAERWRRSAEGTIYDMQGMRPDPSATDHIRAYNSYRRQNDTLLASPSQLATATPMQAPLQAPQAYDWSGYRQQARDATAGMNQMPYTFSNYGQMNGMKLEDIMKMFYPGWKPPGQQAEAPAQPDYSGMSGIVYRGGEYG